MFKIDEEYLKGFGYENLSGKERDEAIREVKEAVIERVVQKLIPKVPELPELFEEAKREFKKEIEDFRSLGSES
jgi:hypothetical protein